MKIASWNVNSIRARLPLVLQWLGQNQPDVLLLQELKCTNSAFPGQEFEEMGYNLAIHGEKTYNGVAIIAKNHVEDVVYGLPTYPEDNKSRYIEAVVGGKVRVASVYVPNGQSVGSVAYHYKLEFLDKLKAHLQNLLQFEEICLIGGDYNIAPTDLDVYDPAQLEGEILCSSLERKSFQSLCHLGYQDALRLYHKELGPFTWWDYRAQSFANNKGLRIDHFLVSPVAVDHLLNCQVDINPRFATKTSDHAPIWCILNL